MKYNFKAVHYWQAKEKPRKQRVIGQRNSKLYLKLYVLYTPQKKKEAKWFDLLGLQDASRQRVTPHVHFSTHRSPHTNERKSKHLRLQLLQNFFANWLKG